MILEKTKPLFTRFPKKTNPVHLRHAARVAEVKRLLHAGKTQTQIADLLGFKCSDSVAKIVKNYGLKRNKPLNTKSVVLKIMAKRQQNG